MPVHLPSPTSVQSAVVSEDYPYKYPRGLNLDPKGQKHQELLSKIYDRAIPAYQKMQTRHSAWRSLDKMLKAYVEPGKAGRARTDGTHDKVILPETYINQQTILTYMMNAFVQDPIWTFTGTGPEDHLRAMLHTEILDLHVKRFGAVMPLHTAWRDGITYGIGASHARWFKEFTRPVVLGENGERTVGDLEVLYEGNKLDPIDPYRLILDPNVPAHEIGSAEFMGWVQRTSYANLRNQEIDNPEQWFNVQYLRHVTGGSVRLMPEPERLPSHVEHVNSKPVDILWFYINLIPEDWELGRGKDPEIWLFAVAGDKLIIAARPMGLMHGKIPAAVCAPDTDGYSATPVSRLEMFYDLQDHINFLFSSHIANVQAAVNNILVYDPFLINTYDVNDPGPGKRIRLRKAAWGKGGIDAAIKQLPVQDVTQNHMLDVSFLRQFGKEFSGANDNLRGQVANTGPRISASAAQGARAASLSRMEKDAILIGVQYMQPLGRIMAAHTMQFMTEPVLIETSGELRQTLESIFPSRTAGAQVQVSFQELLGKIPDIQVHDGSIPGKEDAQSWITFLQVAGQIPQAMQTLDFPRLMTHIARQLGAKSVSQFVREGGVQAAPDAQVEQQVQQGNLVPLNGIQ